MKLSEFLKLAKSKIDTPETWTQRRLARNEHDEPCPYDIACKFCSIGAVNMAMIEKKCLQNTGMLDLVIDVLDEAALNYGYGSIVTANDFQPHPEVMKVWDTAIEIATRKENETI